MKPVYVQIFWTAILEIKMKWTHCTTIWSIFTGRMSSVIKKNAGRGGWVHQEVGVPRRGWRRSLIRKMLEMMTTERDPTAQQVERGEGDLSVRSVSGCQVMTQDSCPTLEGGSSLGKLVPVIFSVTWQWGKYLISEMSKSCLGSWNNKSFFSLGKDEGWVRVTSTAALPKPLPLHTSTPLNKYFFSPTVLLTSALVIFPRKTWMKSLGVFLKELLFSQIL